MVWQTRYTATSGLSFAFLHKYIAYPSLRRVAAEKMLLYRNSLIVRGFSTSVAGEKLFDKILVCHI